MQSESNRPSQPDPWYNLDPAQPQNPFPSGSYAPPGGLSPDYERRYALAARRVQGKLDFYKHLTSFVIIIGFLWLLALFTHSGFWPVFPMLGWGVGLAFHAVAAFGFSLTEQQRQHMIEEELRRMSGGRP